MAGKTTVFEMVEDATSPNLIITMDGAEEVDFTAINLRVRRPDGKAIDKPAVIDDPGDVATRTPLVFHFEWDAGDIMLGVHQADLQFFADGKLLVLPEHRKIQIVARSKA